MIVKLKGTLDDISDDSINLEVSGVVYKILMSLKDLNKIEKIGEELKINIHEILREDARYLFGFIDLNEKKMFEDLIKVQGVGGKMALNIISNMNVNDIVKSVTENNSIIFTKISGVGNKLSKRLLNELKDKICDGKYILLENNLNTTLDNTLFLDLSSCLINLGYPEKIAEDVARKILFNNEHNKKKLENLIPEALKLIKNSRSKSLT